MRAFVTGGSGFLGRRLLSWLGNRGVAVRALSRSPASDSVVAAHGAIAVRGALGDVAALQSAMTGCDVVIHAAASTQEWGTYASFYEPNVTGTANVLAAARAAGVPRLVHVSTEAVLLDGSPLVRVGESRPIPDRPIGPYAQTKALAERAALAASRDGLDVVVVRPRFIWGRGDTTLLPKLAEMARTGRFAWIGGGTALTSTCHVANACEGILLAAQHGAPGNVYFLTDGVDRTYREALTAILATQRVDPGSRTVPLGVARVGAAVVESTWRVLGVKRPPPIQRTSVLLIGQEMTVDDGKARKGLGYTSHMSWEAGLRELAEGRG